MSLRKKTILLLSGIFFILFFALGVFSRGYFLKSFSNLENQYVLRNLNQSVGGLEEKVINLSKFLIGWSNWDDTYKYSMDRNKEFEISNMNTETLLQSGLNGVVIVNANGEIIFDKCLNEDGSKKIPLPFSILEAIQSEKIAEKLRSNVNAEAGLIEIDGKPAIIAIRPILTSEGNGPSRGLIVMYKNFGNRDIQDLSRMMGLSIEVNSTLDPELPDDYKEALVALKNHGSSIKILNEDRVGAYTLVEDIYSNQPFILRIDAQRLISSQGKITVNFFMTAIFALGIFVTVMILSLMEKMILYKIKILGDSARNIKESGDLSIRVDLGNKKEVGSKDELEILAANTNDMLDRIQEIDKALMKEKNAAEAANIEKSAFLANMSHEIETPMNAIVGMTELLMETNLGEKQREYAYSVNEAGNLLLNIINDILDFSKIEAGKFSINHTNFNISDTVESVAELLSVKAHEKGLSLLTYVPADMPMIKGDPDRMKQILLNLVGNAVKFTDEGEISIEVEEAGYTEKNLTLNFFVRDTGIGIEKQDQKKLFQPFIQADDSTTRIYGGTGLGLSISKRIIELMDGYITLESELGVGSEFKFQIKFEKGIRNAVVEKKLTGLNILIISDNELSGRIMESYLEAYGVRLVRLNQSFEDGLEDILKKENTIEKYDLVIIDLKGKLEEQYWELPKKTGISSIVVSPYDPITDNIVPVALGFSALLIKPVKRAQLINCVSMLTCGEINLSISRSEENQSIYLEKDKITEKSRDKILLVDDNKVNRKLALLQLEKLGVDVEIAVNGKEAVDLIALNRYDLVLMDCQMPVMDGFEATKNIRLLQTTQGYRVIIVAMTANAMSGDKEKCLAEGMDDYMAKPVRLLNLMDIFDKWGIKHGQNIL